MQRPDVAIHKLNINGISLDILDFATSSTPVIVRKELQKNQYNVDSIDFSPGDFVLDIGAHVGIVSIYVAKRFPHTKIYAFEPIPDNYEHLVANLELNGIRNVFHQNLAVTGDGRTLEMTVNFSDNSGGGTGNVRELGLSGHFRYAIKSLTLDQIFGEQHINRCKLLKIDCEGSEYEILLACHCLERVEYLSGEFHSNQNLASQGYDPDLLRIYCEKLIQPGKLKIKTVRMAE